MMHKVTGMRKKYFKLPLFMLLTVLMMISLIGCNKEVGDTVAADTTIQDDGNTVEDPIEEEPIEETVVDETPEETVEVVETEIIEDVVEEPIVPEFVNELTGLAIDESLVDRRPIAVTISNIEYALPHYGVSQADIMIETLAEGGIPRLLCVFKDFDSEKIGPIRSGRHYLLYMANDVNALYVHYGKSPQATTAFNNYNAEHLDGLSDLDEVMTYQDPERNRPHATFTTDELLFIGVDIRGYSPEVSEEDAVKFTFSTEQLILDGEDANYVRLPFSWYSPYFEYNDETGLYDRFQYGEAHVDAGNDEQLAFTNIIIQATDMWVIPGDTEGRLDMSLFVTGDGYYMTGGQYVPITWERTGYNDITRYYYEDGSEIQLNTGKTYIAYFPTYQFGSIELENRE